MFTLLITFYMIYIYFIDIFKCKLVDIVVLCVKKHNYTLILISNIDYVFNVYTRYYYKGKHGYREERIAFKECFYCFNCSFKFTVRKVMLFCC